MALLRASSSPCLDKLALTARHSARRNSDNKHDSTKVASQACEHFCGLIVTLRSCAPSFECSAAPSSESSMSRSNYCIRITTNTTQKQSLHTSRALNIQAGNPASTAISHLGQHLQPRSGCVTILLTSTSTAFTSQSDRGIAH